MSDSEMNFSAEELLGSLAKRWPSAIVARSAFGEFSGGAILPKTVANCDARGEGPAQRAVVNGKVVYPVESAIEFLRSRMKPAPKDTTSAQAAMQKKRVRRGRNSHEA
ncbi:hypothetical protein [Fundidesulfovibrio butyratiphilus]